MQIEPGKSYLMEGPAVTMAELLSIPDILPFKSEISLIDQIEVIEKGIAIEDLRNAIANAAQKPFGKYRIFYLQNADELSEVCQNTLLKFLEEPPTYIFVIIQTEHPERLLRTILSRLAKLDGNKPKKTDYEYPKKFLEDAKETEAWFDKAKRDGVINMLQNKLSDYKMVVLDEPKDENIKKILLLEQFIQRLRGNLNQKLSTQLFLLNWFQN